MWPPNPIFVTGSWTYAAGQHDLEIVFDRTMAEDTEPEGPSWLCKIDGVPRTITDEDWTDATTLFLHTDFGNEATVSVTIELLVADPLLMSTLHKVVLPFGPETLPIE